MTVLVRRGHFFIYTMFIINLTNYLPFARSRRCAGYGNTRHACHFPEVTYRAKNKNKEGFFSACRRSAFAFAWIERLRLYVKR
jgi:hypothetical protein